jgi:DNA-binding NarL/FixJ family response regulator
MSRMTIAVCSTDLLMLPGITDLLDHDPRMTVVPAEQVPVADLVLVVAEEVDDTTRDLLARIARSSPARVVLMIDQLDNESLPELARYRVRQIVARHAADDLIAAIDTAMADPEPPADPTAHLLAQLAPVTMSHLGPRVEAPTTLAPRERELVRLLAEGYDTAEIAKSLSYSERTVKNIVHGMLNRLRLRNRAHVVAFAMRAGVL